MIKALTPVLTIACLLTLAACDQNQNGAEDTTEAETSKALAKSWGKRPTKAKRTEQQDIEAAILVEAPETGVDLGWGWNTFRAEPIPTVCIEFAREEDDAQTTTLDFKEVNDSFELMETMDVSAEVSVKTIGYSAKGKAKFAKEVNVSGSSSTFVVEAEVRNGASYAGPTVPRSVRGARAASTAVDGEGAVRLTAAAEELAREDVEIFKEVCGNGYVSATMGGAQLTAVVNIETSSRSQKETIEASISGKGWGAKVDAAMKGGTSEGATKFKREISFYQTGGKDQQLPTDTAAILKRVEDLAEQATLAQKLFQVAITPYQVLENWPRGEELTGEEAEFDELAALWGAYNTMYDEIQEAMDAPEGFVVPVAACQGLEVDPDADTAEVRCPVTFKTLAGDDDTFRILEDLQDQVLAALDRLELDAEDCVEDEQRCAFAGESYRSPYSIRASLPVRSCFLVPAADPPADPAPTACDASGEASLGFYADTLIREMAKSRCRFGSLTPGCLSNQAIREWGRRIGMRSTVVESKAIRDAAVTALGNTPAVHTQGDPGAEGIFVVWYAGDQANKVKTAVTAARKTAEQAAAQ